MESGPAIRFRVDPHMHRLLERLRNERDVNISAWVRRHIRTALQQEFPEETETQATQPEPQQVLDGWKPCRVGQGWGSALAGPGVAQLRGELRGTRITVTDSKGHSWTATINEVVSRSETRIVVRDSGRPGAS